ncbi:MAG: DUF2062 domain-containing protein [bacterium]
MNMTKKISGFGSRVKSGMTKIKNLKNIKEFFKQELGSGSSPEKLALSFCVGLYIACSPFIGAHTLMMFASRWLFGLNLPILFVATSLNNPWTMVPVFAGEYVFGHWLVHSFLHMNPTWTLSLGKIFGSGSVCLWSFFIGCNILGIVLAVLAYPVIYMVFKKISGRLTAG